jgi:hypothetical protein
MNKREFIKQHLSQLNLRELLRYRLLLCSSGPWEDIELDITDLFKYPARLETSYFDNWHKDVLKALFKKLEGELVSSDQVDKKITDLLSAPVYSVKDNRILALFEDFLASLQGNNVVLLHSSLQRKLDSLIF